MPTEIPTNTPIETPTKVTTAFELPSEPSTEPSITTTPITTAAPSTTETPTSPPTIQTFSTFGSTGARIGESYLGGWNEDEGVIVTTSGPSLGSAMNQFSEIPESIPINDDQAIKAYYEKYYAEWYQWVIDIPSIVFKSVSSTRKHNQASSTSEVVTSAAPREIKIGLAKKLHGIESTTQSFVSHCISTRFSRIWTRHHPQTSIIIFTVFLGAIKVRDTFLFAGNFLVYS